MEIRILPFGQIDPYICRTIQKCISIRHKDIIKHSEVVTKGNTSDYKGNFDLLLIFEAVRAKNAKRFQFKLSSYRAKLVTAGIGKAAYRGGA